MRRGRPNLGRQASPLGAALVRSAAVDALAGLLLLSALGFLLARALGLGAAYLPTALAVYVLVLAIAAPLLPRHRPHRQLGPGNRVTLLRGGLVGLLAGLIGEANTPTLAWTALALALSAEALDGIDGYLARRSGYASPFGARFDMETDGLTVAVLALLAFALGKAGPWVLAAGLLRYLFVAAGYRWTWLNGPLPPSRRRQTACVVQILTLAAALAPALPPAWSAPLAAAGLGFLIYSFAVDTLWLSRRAAGRPT